MKSFDTNTSNQVKALAIILMLGHHLWAQSQIGLYIPTPPIGVFC